MRKFLSTVAVEQVLRVAAGKKIRTSVCSPSSWCLPVGSVTNSAALFTTFQLTAGKPEEPPHFSSFCPEPALLQGRTCWKWRGDCTQTVWGHKGAFLKVIALWNMWNLSSAVPPHCFFHNQLWCFAQVSTMLWPSKHACLFIFTLAHLLQPCKLKYESKRFRAFGIMVRLNFKTRGCISPFVNPWQCWIQVCKCREKICSCQRTFRMF